jgi:hypothetical protein
MHNKGFAARLAAAAVFGTGLALAAGPAQADDGPVYEVSITNITRGQVLTPPVVVLHSAETGLFTLGAPAGDGLSLLAEDGVTGPGLPMGFPDDGRSTLIDELAANPEVADYAVAAHPTNDPPIIHPGESVTVEVATHDGARLLSVVGMLASTNDAFAAVAGVRLRRGARSLHLTGGAYDAGTEVNSEDCTYIPGPPCGNAGVRDTVGAEGFVHSHAGIHGLDDLDPAEHDWRNPVIAVTVQRVQ